jgi:hypothetical protein
MTILYTSKLTCIFGVTCFKLQKKRDIENVNMNLFIFPLKKRRYIQIDI